MKKINFTLAILLLISPTQQSCASQFQSIASIQQAARKYITANLNSSIDYKFKLGKIDSRLKLALCSKALDISTPKGELKAGRNSIGVRCHSKKKWAIYTSVIIHIYQKVVVLSRPIKRGELYISNSLAIEKREISSLRSGFFINPENIINKQASRNLNAGTVISQSNITEPKLIKRGEKVTINISSPNLTISAAGIALMDGIKNQNIRIKNITSKQIIQATVVKQGQVVVTF
jgi:flagella basal body P-ring formation protein FlgA